MKLPWEDDEYGFKQNNSTLPWEKDEYSLKQTSNKLPWEEEISYTPAKKEPKPNLLQRAGETVKSLIPSKETRDSISHTLFPAALSGKEGGLIENAIKNEQALRSRENLGKGEAFLSGVRSGAMFGAGADEIRANNPQASGWVTGGEVLGSLIPSIGLYGGTLKAGQAATKLPGIGQALAKASPLAKVGATGFVSEGAYGLGHGLLEGERGADLAKTTAMYGAIGGVADVTLTKVIGPAISKVLQRFKGKPVATETIERAVAKDIGVNWDNMNDTQKKAIREKIIAEMQKDPIQSGRALNVGQEFTMRDVTPQDRLKQVLPEGPLALPQPKQNFTLEPEPFKKQIPKVDFEKPRPIQTPQPKTETFYPPQDDFPLYHGTWRKHKGFEDGRDFYFTDNKEFAKSFIREPREGTDLGGELLGGRLKPSAKVLDTRTPEGKKIADEIIKADEVMSYNGVESFKRDSFRDGLPIYSKDNFIKAAKEKGYDAIVLSERDGITSHRIFNKKAIDVKTINDKTPLTFEINKRPGTPIEARDFENVGDRSIKAISFENPQIRPYYQYEAQNLLGEMQYAVPGKRTVAYNEFDEMVFTGQKKSVSDSIETIQAITGASYKEIEKGLQDIIYDKGRENNALSKRIELIIDENLSSGYKAFDGRPIPPNQDYLKAKENLYVQPKLREPLRLNAGQNFGMSEPIYRKQVPREFDKTPIPTELPDYVTNDPLRLKRTIEVPARKLQPDLTPPQIKANKQTTPLDLTPPKINAGATQRVIQSDVPGNADTFRGKINRDPSPKKRTFAETFERIRTQFIDDLAPLEGLEKRVRGTIASAEDSLYKQARLFRGVPEKAYNTINTQLKPIINSIEKQGYSYQDLGDYALAVHARDVNARGINSGFTDAEINAVLQKYANTPLEEARKQLNRVSDNMLKELVDSEVITKEMYQALKEKWPNYMPLFRSFDDSKVDFATGLSKALANATSPIKRLEGSSRDVIDPIESMIKNIFNITNTSQRNRVGLQLAKLANEDTAGLIRRLTKNEDVGRKNVVSVLQNGEKVRYEVEPEVYKALLNLNKEGSNLLMKILAKPASLLRAGATLTPEFSLRNPIRDIPFALTVSKSKLKPIDIGLSLWDTIKGKRGKSTKLYNQWLEDMGGYGNIISMDRNVHKKALEDVLTKPAPKEFINILNPQSWLSVLRTIADVSESATKLGEYRAALRQGVSRPEAAYRSRDIMDFARAGYSTREANKIIAFLNANIQGKSKLWRSLQENPTGVVARATATVTLPTIAMYAGNYLYANEKQKETIKDAPDWLKNTFWLVAVPGTDQVARIPKPFDLAPMFANFYERLMDRVIEDDPKAFDDFIRTTLGEESISVIPTALLPIIEGMSNKSFFRDAPIIPQREEGLRYQDQHDINTSETAKLIGKGIDNLTGGEGSFKNFGSPRIIDNTIRGYTAGLGTLALSALDVIFEGLGEVEKPDKPTKQFSQLPVARAFFVNPSSTGKSVDYVYTELDKLRRERGSASQGKGMFFEESKYKFLNERASRISEVSKEIRNVTNHPTMGGDEKRDRLQQLNDLRNRIARDTKKRLEKGN